MASPAALRATADELDALAGRLDQPLETLAALAARTAWRGPAATRASDRLRLERIRVADAADELRYRARVLRARAAAAERTTPQPREVPAWIG
jgi:hypothetical protein